MTRIAVGAGVLTGVVVAGLLAVALSAQAIGPTTQIKLAPLSVGGATVNCPRGKVAGGGYDVTSGDEASVSRPSDGSSWNVDAYFDFDLYGTAYAVCSLADVTISQVQGRQVAGGNSTSVSCASGSKVIGGGFEADDPLGGYSVSASYPDGPRSWRVAASKSGRAYAVCSVSALTITIQSKPLAAGKATVTCPNALANVLGGGFVVKGKVPANFPSGPRAWTVEASQAKATGTAYAVCAVQL